MRSFRQIILTKNKFLGPAVLVGLWVLMVLLVRPAGEFPLMDDWSYSRAVRFLVEEGRLTFTEWESLAPAVSHVLLGALFCVPFGFSFLALRIFTLTVGLVGVFATYALLKQTKSGDVLAFFGAAALAVNPVYFALSNTFMTDVPFYALGVLSLLFFVRGIDRGKTGDIIVGSVLALAATLTRQTGLTLCMAFAVGYVARYGLTRKRFLAALLPLVFTLGGYVAYETNVGGAVGLRALSLYGGGGLPESLFRPDWWGVASFLFRTGVAVSYLGLFLLPLLVVLLWGRLASMGSRRRRRTVLLLVGAFGLLSVVWLVKDELMPFRRATLSVFGAGPVTLRDVAILKLSNLVPLPRAFWVAVTMVTAAGAVLLVQNICAAMRRLFSRRERRSAHPVPGWVVAMALALCVVYYVPFGLIGFLDRYLILLIPLLMMGLSSLNRADVGLGRSAWCIAVSILVVFALFSVGATHDYFAWNRARWRALGYLTEEEHIPPSRIDGGLEFNAWHLYDPKYRVRSGKSFYWVHGDDYVVSFGPIPGYDVWKVYGYRKWLPPGRGRITLLRKTSPE